MEKGCRYRQPSERFFVFQVKSVKPLTLDPGQQRLGFVQLLALLQFLLGHLSVLLESVMPVRVVSPKSK
jgi:hypothetical protein